MINNINSTYGSNISSSVKSSTIYDKKSVKNDISKCSSQKVGFDKDFFSKNIYNNASYISFCGRFDNMRAKSYAKNFDRTMSLYDAVLNFRNSIEQIAQERDNSTEDYFYFAKRFYDYRDYLRNNNPFYRQNPLKYANADDIFGHNSRVYFTQKEITLPFDNRHTLVNIPSGVAIDYSSDGLGNVSTAREIYDFTNNGLLGTPVKNSDGSISVPQVNIFNPDECNIPYVAFLKAMGTPATINNVTALPNGNFRADSLVLYNFDSQNNLVSSTTYIQPEVYYGKSDKKKHGLYFSLTAKCSYETVYDKKSKLKNTFMYRPALTYANGKAITNAQDTIIDLGNNLSLYYGDYSETRNSLYYGYKQVVDISKVK